METEGIRLGRSKGEAVGGPIGVRVAQTTWLTTRRDQLFGNKRFPKKSPPVLTRRDMWVVRGPIFARWYVGKVQVFMGVMSRLT